MAEYGTRRLVDREDRRQEVRRSDSHSGLENRRFSRTERARQERYRRPDIVSTVVKDDDRRRRQEPQRQDSRFESVSSNLPPGMILKFRRR